MQLRNFPRRRTTAVLKADNTLALFVRVLLALSGVNVIPNVLAKGKFEVTIREMWNPRGKISTGQCCGLNGTESADGRCSTNCQTFFSVCLGFYGGVPSSCSLGKQKTLVIGANSFTPTSNNILTMEFTFGWPGAFSLVLKASDKVSENTSKLIETVRVQNPRLLPSATWKHVTHVGSVANMSFSYRIVCNKNYYDNRCNTFCIPRDDNSGHFTCGPNGTRICNAGWQGSHCLIPVCRQGCNSLNGGCSVPGECNCVDGWRGNLCNQCSPHPSCVYGTCNRPYECNCNPGWGGIYCNLALDRCGREDPCKNDASCQNVAAGEYKCICKEGFEGRNCEIDINECSSNPCENGGTCTDLVADFNCTCVTGYRGKTCNININDCTPDACFNGGTCIDGVANFTCICPAGFTGSMCECAPPTSPVQSNSKRSTVGLESSGEPEPGSQNKSKNGTKTNSEQGSTVLGSSENSWSSLDAADKEKLIIAITVSVIVGVCLVGSCFIWKHVRKRTRCVRNREGTVPEAQNSDNAPKGKSLDDKEVSCEAGTNAGPHRVALNNPTPANIIINFIPTKDTTAKVNSLKEQNLSSYNKTAEKELVRKSVELSQITDPADWDEIFLPNRCTFDKGYWQEVEVEI